jgi:outer membrane receptor protein involved in Fe transport
MKGMGTRLMTAALLCMMITPCWADSETNPPDQEQVHQLDDVVVKEKIGAPGVEQTPIETVIEVQALPTIGVPNSIVDILKGHAIIDFRGESDIDAGVDSINLRGFDSKRFVTALDGLTVQKTGGRKSSNIVDYSLLPAFLIDSVEILPGPHSALYDCKSIGGVINFTSAKPKRYDSLTPQGRLTTSYSTYNTQMHNLTLQGGVEAVTYDLAYQKSSSDGYLRHNETESDIFYGRIGLVLPSDGFITLSGSYSEIDREAPIPNTGDDYDSDYPEVESAAFSSFADPQWDSDSYAYRLNYEQNLPIGRLSVGAYTGRDNRIRSYYTDEEHTNLSVMDTDWWQEGGKIRDEIKWSDKHTSTIGFDTVQLSDNGVNNEKTERITKNGAFLQHQWAVLPSVDIRLGVRYEDVRIKVTNNGAITGREDLIERNFDELVPKSFITWKMDQAAPWLRDTSLSLGVSKIWHAPDFHGTYNPQGRPAGAWLEPEHGMGYDLVLNRRLWRDIALKLNYSFYDIKDYFAYNRTYAQYSGAGAGSLRYSDYVLNLEQVHRHGIDLELGGHLTDDLSFYLTYAWQKFSNQGDEPAGETELHKQAEHRMTAGLVYALFEKTTLMLDYYYQSEETTETAENLADDDEDDIWIFHESENPSYSVVNFGVQQLLYKSERSLREARLKVYVKNLFDEEYSNASGYPATDRTFGVSLSLSF